MWQEVELVRGRDELEWRLPLLWALSSVISEGVATAGPRIVAGDGLELAASVLGRLGFEYDADVGARVAEAGRLLQGVSANVAMLLHAHFSCEVRIVGRARGSDARCAQRSNSAACP